MYRKATEELEKWKKSKNRKPLILRGARQVGKTWLLKHFGESNYESVAYFSLEDNPELSRVFEYDLDPHRIIRELGNIGGIKITPDSTLVILDEIQSVPKALTSLKYFCENAPEYHVAVAGSLLGIMLHPGTSFPVGKVDFIDIYPMDFYEYLCAINKKLLADAILNDDMASYSDAIHDTLMYHLKTYMVVGGMPEAIKTYLDTNNYSDTRRIQDNILTAYRSDFSKHAPKSDIFKIEDVYNAVPVCLSREHKKFIFGAIRKSARSREYELALAWLEDANMVTKVERVNAAKLPLMAYASSNIFKLFFSDIGLLGAKMQLEPKLILTGDRLFEEYKGAFAEQLVFQEMRASGITSYYYSNNDSKGEIDFIIQTSTGILPIEVKSGKNLSSVSLNNFLKKWGLPKGIKFSVLPYKENDNIDNLPLYLVNRLKNY